MVRIRRNALLASMPLAFALVFTGTTTAASAAAGSTDDYTIHFSATSATTTAGGTTRTVVSFTSEPYLRHTRVTLSVSHLPDGVTATFRPATPQLGGRSVLTLRTSPTTPRGKVPVIVAAITLSSDPIGTSAAFGLSVT
jgi:hypothetical protein